MTVRVVTDSTSDLPPQVAQELGITVVPLYVHFGTEVYKDGIDLSADEFYRRLIQGQVLPTTSAPSAGVFTQVYNQLAAETDEIVSIHISAKLSGTYDSALLGKESVGRDCHIEVIDSLSTSMGCGLLAVAAAKEARKGANLEQITAMLRQTIPRAHLFGLVDTLDYLYKGGRIGKVQALLGTALNVKPIITVKEGEAHPLKRVRTRPKAIEEMCKLAKELLPFREVAILHSTTPQEAEKLAERLADLFPLQRIYRSRFGPVMGTYVGPGALGIALIREEPAP
jgi:DegV family protein with EDD domain